VTHADSRRRPEGDYRDAERQEVFSTASALPLHPDFRLLPATRGDVEPPMRRVPATGRAVIYDNGSRREAVPWGVGLYNLQKSKVIHSLEPVKLMSPSLCARSPPLFPASIRSTRSLLPPDG
jgi:hypothetical protein